MPGSIDYNPPYTIFSLLSEFFVNSRKEDQMWGEEDGWVQTLCGRSALKTILLYLEKKGILEGGSAQILVPQWTCNSVHQTIQKVCFPSNRVTKGLRGVMIYHQYGFPQNMVAIDERCAEEGLFVIENAVNCVDSYWKKHSVVNQQRRIATIFSWSKLFPVVLGGALQSDNKHLIQFCRDHKKEAWKVAEIWSVIGRILFDKSNIWGRDKITDAILEMSAAISDFGYSQPLTTNRFLQKNRILKLIARRKSNYLRFQEILLNTGLLDNLEKDVVPYVVPVQAPETKLEKINNTLNEIGVNTGIYHFDTNRNVFDPRYEKTILVPVHPSLSDEKIEEIGKKILAQI